MVGWKSSTETPRRLSAAEIFSAAVGVYCGMGLGELHKEDASLALRLADRLRSEQADRTVEEWLTWIAELMIWVEDELADLAAEPGETDEPSTPGPQGR